MNRKLSFLVFIIFSLNLNVIANSNSKKDKVTSYIKYDEYEEYDKYESGIKRQEINDPLEKFNRKTTVFNLFLLNNLVNPFLKSYRFVVPKFIRKGVVNIGDRLSDVPTLINSILILDYKNSIKTIGVFTTNMTVGVFGFFDVAKKFDLVRTKMSLGDVLAYYNVKNGMYLVIPFLGPSTLRDSVGSLGGFLINPLSENKLEIASNKSWTPNNLVFESWFAYYIKDIENADKLNKQFLKKSFDPYVFMKEAYIKNRNNKIKKIK